MCFFFFFSSRRRHTRLTCDWSSDVCSSDLGFKSHETKSVRISTNDTAAADVRLEVGTQTETVTVTGSREMIQTQTRSEERRVGKECRSRWSPEQSKKKRQR